MCKSVQLSEVPAQQFATLPEQNNDTQKPLSIGGRTFLGGVLNGSASGMCTAIVIQPMIYFKNVCQTETQSKQNVFKNRFDPRLWYRGCAGFAASFVPTTALQTATKDWLTGSGFNPMIAAVGAGLVSSGVVCPAELVMIQQQKSGKNFFVTAASILKTYGVKAFFRGLIPTGVREGAFTAAYLGGGPAMKKHLKDNGVSPALAQIGSGAIVGTGAAVVSHAFDSQKTRLQANLDSKVNPVLGIFKRSAYAGLGWRVSMVVSATIVISYASEKLAKLM